MRLIDAELLERQAKECAENEWNQRVAPISWAHAEQSFLRRIEDTPTIDAVTVMRCKDCKYHHWEQEPCHGRTEHYCALHKGLTVVTRDSFCSYGERNGGKC